MKRLPRYGNTRRFSLSLYYEAFRAVQTKQFETELALTDNCYFKYVFGRPESTSYLCDLLNVILTRVDERSVKSLTLKDPILNPLFYRQKSAFLDIVAVDETDRIFNVEMQAYKERNLPERFLDYVSGLYSRQLKAGESYEQLNPVVGVMLLDDKVWLKVAKEFNEENSEEDYKDRYFDKIRMKSLYTGVTYSDHLTIILVRVPDPSVSIEELINKTGDRRLAFWLKTLASPNAAYDKELDSFEADAPGLKDLRKDMRTFLAGVGGQFALRGSRRDDSIWVRAWNGGREEGREEGKEEEATNNLIKYLEIRFNKSKKETEPLLSKTSLEDLEAYLGIAYSCDDYDAFVRRAEEVKRRGRSS